MSDQMKHNSDSDEIHSAIKKIKLQEQDKEIKLKEMRAIEATLASLKRNLHETTVRFNKLTDELAESAKRADTVTAELVTAQVLRDSLAAQIEVSNKELQLLKIESEQGISKVWKQRNHLCQEVQKVSDQCDVWALFTKPKFIEVPKPKKLVNDNNMNPSKQNEKVLENALKKRQSLIAEFDRLQNEPEHGKEFLRIRNALRYSEEMVAQMRK